MKEYEISHKGLGYTVSISTNTHTTNAITYARVYIYNEDMVLAASSKILYMDYRESEIVSRNNAQFILVNFVQECQKIAESGALSLFSILPDAWQDDYF